MASFIPKLVVCSPKILFQSIINISQIINITKQYNNIDNLLSIEQFCTCTKMPGYKVVGITYMSLPKISCYFTILCVIGIEFINA